MLHHSHPHRIGILGGTFDPPHHAHLILGEHAREQLQLEQVLFVPAGVPPHKSGTRTPVLHRLAMLELAIAGNPYFSISRVDIDRQGPHYSVDMIDLLRGQYRGASFTFMVGEDSFDNLPSWHRPQDIIAAGDVTIAVMERDTGKPVRPDQHEVVIPGLADTVVLLDIPHIEISSTTIVDRIRRNLSVRYLLPDTVLDYIHHHNLYEDAD